MLDACLEHLLMHYMWSAAVHGFTLSCLECCTTLQKTPHRGNHLLAQDWTHEGFAYFRQVLPRYTLHQHMQWEDDAVEMRGYTLFTDPNNPRCDLVLATQQCNHHDCADDK